jgi:hypothetical protein
MNSHPVYLLAPVFRFLDWLIREHGDFLSSLFVYVGLPLIAWFLGRRSARRKPKRGHTFVLVVRPPAQSSEVPPVIRWNFDSPNDDSGPFGGL